MNLIKQAIRSTSASPALRALLARSFAKANAYFESVTNEELLAIYLRHKEFTCIPPEMFVANLSVIARYADVPGCVVECGVWRGGMSAGMADLLGPKRSYHLLDSFEGLPDAQGIDGARALEYTASDSNDNCRAEEHFAAEAMARSRATDWHLHKGWFSETLAGFVPKDPIAVLRLDGDWYSSTAECLNALYPLVPEGGVIVIDDYFPWTGCSRAVHDYLSANGCADRIQTVDTMFAFIEKREQRASYVSIDPAREI